MECPRCEYANAGGARFCGECGASLTRDVTCSSCGHANPAGQTFCNGCGGRLDESARSAARDRRGLTPQHLVGKKPSPRPPPPGGRQAGTPPLPPPEEALGPPPPNDAPEVHQSP